MLTRLVRRTAAPLTAALTLLALSCATAQTAPRPVDSTPTTTTPAASAEPVPPPSPKKGVILPTDVKLGPEPATVNTGTAGPAVGPTVGTSTSPN